MKQKLSCDEKLVRKLEENGIVISKPIAANIFEVVSVNGIHVKDIVCKIFVNSPKSSVLSEYTIASKSYAADPDHFLKVYGPPIVFSVEDIVFGGRKECSAILMEKGTPLTANQKTLGAYIDILEEICLGVDSLHENDIVHLDIKPGNILVNDGHIRLIDFGISRFISRGSIINSFAPNGTKYFISPELFRGIVGCCCDIYSTGMSLRCLLLNQSERLKSNDPDELLVEKKSLLPLHADDSYVDDFLRIVNKMTAFSPSERYKTMREVLADLKSFKTKPTTKNYSLYYD